MKQYLSLVFNGLCRLELHVLFQKQLKCILDRKHFESITIYRPGLLRLSEGRKFRREKSSRMLEWTARQFSDIFDWGDWWSIRTDDLAKVIVQKSISTQDAIQNDRLVQVRNK